MKQCDGERRQTRKEGNWFLMMRNYETKGNTRRKQQSWQRNFKCGQEKESSDADRNGRGQTWTGTVYDLHNTISQTCQQNTRNKANKMNSDFCFMSVLCLKFKKKKNHQKWWYQQQTTKDDVICIQFMKIGCTSTNDLSLKHINPN